HDHAGELPVGAGRHQLTFCMFHAASLRAPRSRMSTPLGPRSYDLISSRYRLNAFITGTSLKPNKKAGRSPPLTCSQNVHVGTVNTSLSSQSSRWPPTTE